MITDTILYIFGFFIDTTASIATFISFDWHVWPRGVLDGFTYFFQSLMKLNLLFPIDTLLQAILFLVGFLSIFYSVKILLKIINWTRGSGSIDI